MRHFNPFNISPQAVQIFLAAAKNESFSLAAKQLNISQPLVSRTIAALEHEMGFPLFIRNNRRVSLSAPGSYLMTRWEYSYQSFTSAANDAYNIYVKKQNSLTIMDDVEMDKTLYLFPIINEFQAANNDTIVNIEQLENRDGFNHVLSGIANIGFAVKGFANDLTDLGISYKMLIEVPTVVDVPPTFPDIYKKKHLTVRDLDGMPILLISPSYTANYNKDVLEFFREAGVEPRIHSYASSRSALFFKRNFVDALVVANPFYNMPTHRAVRRIPCEGKNSGLLIYWDKNSGNQKTKVFVDIACEYFSKVNYQNGRFVK